MLEAGANRGGKHLASTGVAWVSCGAVSGGDMGDDLTGRVLLGRYRIVAPVGQGGMGTVWRGIHLRVGRQVAIKVLDERFLDNDAIVERFGREARAASAIQHPGIVEVLDLDRTDEGVPFIVMEYLDGETLGTRLGNRSRLTQAETVELMSELLSALDAAHEHGVVHRDLKPENIILVPRARGEETVKILDFGISHKLDERVTQLTMAGAVLGTPHYMAPEQAKGDSQVDGRADVYAAGVLMYECLTGDVPFDAPNYNKLIQIILNETPTPPTERGAVISASVERVILHALEKERRKRPQSAGEMLRELKEAVLNDASVPSTPSIVRQSSSSGPPSGNLAATLAEGDSEPPDEAGPVSTDYHAAADVSASAAPLPDLVIEPRRSVPPVERRGGSVPPAGRVGSELAEDPVDLPAPGPVGSFAPPSGELDVARLGGDDTSDLELDEAVLVKSRRPPRPLSMPPAGPSVRPPSGPPSGSHSLPPSLSSGRYRTVGNVSSSWPAAPMEPAESWHRRIPVPLRYGTLVLVLFVGVVVGMRALAPGNETPTPTVTVPDPLLQAPPPPERQFVRIEVGGLPVGATLRLDGLPAGSLPMSLRVGTEHTLEISASGYETRTLTFVADADKRLSANLHPQIGAGVSEP